MKALGYIGMMPPEAAAAVAPPPPAPAPAIVEPAGKERFIKWERMKILYESEEIYKII
jgi:hypothetical protein